VTPAVRVFGVIGDPIGHSLSPLMHEAAYRALRLQAVYAPFEASPRDLRPVLEGLDAAGIDGLNVTIPHKEAAARWLGSSRLAGDAAVLGAVNTLARRGGRLIGHNTDVAGFRRLLAAEVKRPLAGKTALLLGAGGAARAIAWALIRARVARLVIANRTPARGRQLAAWMRTRAPKVAIETVAWSARAGAARDAALVVNATSLGLRAGDALPLDPSELPKGIAVVDAVYRAPTTAWVAAARRRGWLAVDGVPMLVYQGAAAFQLWWSRPAPVAAMRRAVEHELRRRARQRG
jgi:shikimate dehydrogenase